MRATLLVFGLCLSVLSGAIGCSSGRQGKPAEASAADKTPAGDSSAKAAAELIGTIDLNKIYKAMGISDFLLDRKKMYQDDRNRLGQRRAAHLQAKLKEFGEKRTDAHDNELRQLQAQATRALQDFEKNANNSLRKLQGYYGNLYTEKTQGPIKTVCERRGISVVFYKNSAPLAFSADAIDITDEVLVEMKRLATDGIVVTPNSEAAAKTPEGKDSSDSPEKPDLNIDVDKLPKLPGDKKPDTDEPAAEKPAETGQTGGVFLRTVLGGNVECRDPRDSGSVDRDGYAGCPTHLDSLFNDV